MSSKRYSEEFKSEAVKRRLLVVVILFPACAASLNITTYSLYIWIKKYGPDSSNSKEQFDAPADVGLYQWQHLFLAC